MEEVTLKGFLYQEGEGWILAEKPNLKTCCLKKESHVTLVGDFSQYKQSAPVTVVGTLCESVLHDVNVVETSGIGFPWWTVALVGGILLLYTLLKSSSSLKR